MNVDLAQVRKLCRELDRLEGELEAIFGFVEPAKKAAPPPPPKLEKGAAQPCCGSKGRRHKKDCPGMSTKPVEGLRRYKCIDCDHLFEDECEYMDAICPKCSSTSVIQKH